MIVFATWQERVIANRGKKDRPFYMAGPEIGKAFLEYPMNLIECLDNIASRVYVQCRLAFLNMRFPRRVNFSGEFRRPFFCRVSDSGSIKVGSRTTFNYGCVLISHESIEIGKDSFLSIMSAFIETKTSFLGFETVLAIAVLRAFSSESHWTVTICL